MKRLLLLGPAAALLVCASALAADVAVVGAVKVEGNRRVEAEAVRSAITTKEGEPLDAAKIDGDIRSVMKLGFFSDVVVEERGPSDRPEVVFRVTEKPSVRDVTLEGPKELSADDLKDAVAVKNGSILDLTVVKRTVKKLQDKYVEKGFYLAEITYRLEPRPDNQVSVIFEINEHAKVVVKGIRFIGNQHVDRDELLAVMNTQEGGLLSFITSSGAYREDLFEHDLGNIAFVYGDKGYIYAKVGKPSISLSPDKHFLYITLRIDEGEQYRVGKIDFSGDLLHDKSELRSLIRVEPGDLFARSKVGKDLIALTDLYRDDGYAYANVNPVTNVDPKARTVDLTYEVEPGKKTYFERIEIYGNTKTRDRVIRRELRIYEGELYNQTALQASKARVTALGYFETVDVKTERGSSDDKLIAKVTVKEKSTGTFQLGAGFSSYENFIFTGQISQNNFMGWGQTLSLSVSYSSLRQLGQIQYVDPYFLDTRWTFAFDLYATEGYFQTFQRKALGGSMTWGYELSGLQAKWPWFAKLEDWRLFATYTLESVTVTPTSDQIVQIANQFRSGTSSGLRLTLQIDKRDNRLFATNGWYQSLSAEFAPSWLAPTSIFTGERNLFARYTWDGRAYHPVLFGIVAKLKLQMGYITGLDGQTVPISERYYLGGINSVRGYRLLSIAPKVGVANSNSPDAALYDFLDGGNKQFAMNFELEAPIIAKAGVRAVVFFDMGNTFPQGAWSDPNVSLSLYKSWGFGLRWLSPMGPLRFEWGFPLNRRYDAYTRTYLDSAVDFQFTIGNFF